MGLRCLLRVAAHGSGSPLRIAEIAATEGISPEYAAKLLRRLRLGGLVTSTRGASGGYRLSRPAVQVTVWEAVRVLDDAYLPQTRCDCEPGERSRCRRTRQCAIQSLWRELGDQVRGVLERTTLQELCARESARESDRKTVTLPVFAAS